MTEDRASVSLEMYRLLTEESLTGVYLIQGERFVYVNRRLAELFGCTRDELLALPSVLELIVEGDRALVREKLRQRLSGEIREIEYTVRGQRRDGEVIDLDVRSVRTVHEGRPAVMGSMLDITKQKQLEAALKRLSLVDDLTGVYNRRGFMTLAESHLGLAARRNRELLLIFADVDDLKSINDSYGHAAGDQVLRDAAAVLRRTYRSADIVARIGGDEFTAFPLEASGENAGLLVARLEQNIAAYNRDHPKPYVLSLSVGVGRFDPRTCQTIEQLLAEADQEQYAQKRRRRMTRS